MHDVDGYVAAMAAIDWLSIGAVGIARRLVDAGRPEEALVALERDQGYPRTEVAARELRLAIFEALGRGGDAQELRRRAFETRLSFEHFIAYRERSPDAERAAITARAVAHARDHQLALEALCFLMAVEDHAEVESLIVRRRADIDGASYETVRRVATALAPHRPLGAVLLHRSMALAVLAKANSTLYGYAVKDLIEAARLARLVTDWRGASPQDRFLEELRASHGRKPAFWKRFEANASMF